MKAFFDVVRKHFGPLSQNQVAGIETLLSATSGLDLDHRAYLLATAWHETAHTMQPIYEIGKRAYFDKYEPTTKIGKGLGNTRMGDGFKFRGRGYVQLTGRANYAKASRALAIDLIGNPDGALSPVIAARILVRGCMEGWFTGKKLSDFTSYENMRRVVNGTDKAALIAGYAKNFEAALRAVENVKPAPVPPQNPEPVKPPTGPFAAILAGLIAAVAALLKWAGVW